MEFLDKKIEKVREKFYKSNKLVDGYILSNHYYLKYKYYDDYKSLNSSIETLKHLIKNGAYDEKTFLTLSYLYIKNKDYELAMAYLKKFESYKKYYKNEEKNLYITYLYVRYVVLKYGKKIFQQRLPYIQLIKLAKDSSLAQMFLGKIYIDNKKYDEGYEYLTLAYINGNRSTLLFQALYDYYLNKENNNDVNSLLFKVVTWAIRNGLDVEEIFNSQFNNIKIKSKSNLKMAKEIYNKFENDYLLEQIVIKMCDTRDFDLSPTAFSLYKQCENKQIEIPKLEVAITKCCIKYEDENISRYTMGKYIDIHKVISEEKAYIFHLILSFEKFEDYILKYKNEIINFYKKALDENNINRFFYSGYKYLLLNQKEIGLSIEVVKKLEDILFEKLFTYEITTKNNFEGKIYVTDKYLEGYTEGTFIDKKASIDVLHSEFNYLTFDNESKNAILSEMKVKKFLSGDINTLINYFINKGFDSEYLLISKVIQEIGNIDENNKDYFIKSLQIEELSDYAIKEISTQLGDYFAKKKEYTKAINYYELCNLVIDNEVVVGCIKSYIKNQHIKKAYNLLMINYKFINSDDLLSIINKLYIYKEYHKQLSKVLLKVASRIKNNREYIKILYENLEEDLDVLLKLSNDFDENGLNNKILKLSMLKRIYNKKTERAFVRLYKYNNNQEVIDDYSYYVCYEVLKNNKEASEDVLKILRNLLDLNKDRQELRMTILKCYSKNKSYILNEVEFIDENLKILELNNISLSCFKNLISKKIKNPFVSKYFVMEYIGDSKNEVYLNIKYNNDKFKKIKMDYYKFSLFIYKVPVLYKDTITYYFEEVMPTGSIKSKDFTYTNNKIEIINRNERYFLLNNALIQSEMSRVKDLENTLETLIGGEEWLI